MEIVCLDTNILIEHKRAKQKNKTKLFDLANQGYGFAVSTVTVYELLRGDDSKEDVFWKEFFDKVSILDFDMAAAQIAGAIFRQLKPKGNLIEVEDLLIGAVAIRHKMKLATHNTKHLSRIANLTII
jgi:predicted nucleic acid-binding protein